MSKRPYFPFYPGDWLSAPEVIAMGPAERGAYIQMLAVCWKDPDCSVPRCYREWLRYTGVRGSNWRTLIRVAECFSPHPEIPSRLTHPRLWEEYIKVERASKKGRKGAEARHAPGKPFASPGQCPSDSDSDSESDPESESEREGTPSVSDDARSLEHRRRTGAPQAPPYAESVPCTDCDSGPMTLRPSKFGCGFYYRCEVCDASCDAAAYAARRAKNAKPEPGELCPRCNRYTVEEGTGLCTPCHNEARA